MTTGNRPAPSKHSFKKTKRLLDDFFQVDEYHGAYEQYDNEMSEEHRLLVFERGDSVAALLFDPTHREVILVEQFRLPTAGKGVGGGWILEPAAGIIEAGETARDAIISEIKEETGYHVTDLEPIMKFFASPGGSTERIHLYYAEVRRAQKTGEGGGVRKDRENIRIVQMPVVDFFERLRKNEFEDAKLIIAAQWLRDRQATMSADHTALYRPELRRVKLESTRTFGHRRPKKYVGYMTGDILGVKGVDVWVNPLNTDMMLDRFSDRTVAARIRSAGAEKYPGTRRIKRDTIGEELQRVMGKRNFVKPAKVIDTTSGQLLVTNQVKRIYHVAAIRGEIGEDVGSGLDPRGLH
jgi:nudix-type nucleoside diphosphatase, YffH/AdpP family